MEGRGQQPKRKHPTTVYRLIFLPVSDGEGMKVQSNVMLKELFSFSMAAAHKAFYARELSVLMRLSRQSILCFSIQSGRKLN